MQLYAGFNNNDDGLKLGLKNTSNKNKNKWLYSLLLFLGLTSYNVLLYASVGLDPNTTPFNAPYDIAGEYQWRSLRCGIGSFTRGAPQNFVTQCDSPELDRVKYPASTTTCEH